MTTQDSTGIGALADYVNGHAVRGACRCGRCFDAPAEPNEHQPNGHTASVYFFDVAACDEPNPEEFRSLIREAREGYFGSVDPLDGNEHGYMELGGWLGDQGLALMFMALCQLTGIATVLHPGLLPLPKDLQDQLAGSGMVTLQAKVVEAAP